MSKNITWRKFRRTWHKANSEMGYYPSIVLEDNDDVTFWHPVELDYGSCSAWYIIRSDGTVEDHRENKE